MAIEQGYIFTAHDIDYLVLNFTEGQLKTSLHYAEIEQAVSQAMGEDDGEYYWQEYAMAVQMAMEIIRENKPRPKPSPIGVDIQKLKETVDIVDIIGRYTTLRPSGRNFLGLCCLHNDKHPSLFVYTDKQSFYCFGCNQGGDVVDFIQAAEKCDFRQAATILGSR